jgi:hypothetical protein
LRRYRRPEVRWQQQARPSQTAYHAERDHQGLANAFIENDKSATTGRIARRKRIGGALNFYYRIVA